MAHLDTGIHLTFSPNGIYRAVWEPHAAVLRPLIARGQVQIVNHTDSHADLRRLGNARIVRELTRNDEWVQRTFGTTTRPWFRPPYGFHNQRVDGVKGELGYTRTLLWNGTLGDSSAMSADVAGTGAALPAAWDDHVGARQPSDGHPPLRAARRAHPDPQPHAGHARRGLRDEPGERLSEYDAARTRRTASAFSFGA